jgi:hypothetical protein
MSQTKKEAIDCCSSPSLTETRRLAGSPRKGVATERCAACGADWLHAWNEVAMGGDFDEIDFDTFARVSAEEAAALPESPTDADLAFLAERPVLATQFGGRLGKNTGWRWP